MSVVIHSQFIHTECSIEHATQNLQNWKNRFYWINILQKLLEMKTMLPFTQRNSLLEISEDSPNHIGHNVVNFRGNTIFQCF